MNNPSLSDSDQTLNSDPSVTSSQQAQPLTSENVQGSAMLDAGIEAGTNQPHGEPINEPIATNFSTATTAGDPKTAGVNRDVGASPEDHPSADKGAVNLSNNADIPVDRRDSPQGKLPDTDPMTMSTDPNVNLPD